MGTFQIFGIVDSLLANGNDCFWHIDNMPNLAKKMVQKIVNYGNCLQFPEIPAKFRENFTEKIAISVDFQQQLEKSVKISDLGENLKILSSERCKGL